MKLKHFLLFILLVVTAFFTSCSSEEKHGRAPKFASIELSPSTVSPGDSLTVNISYADRGEYFIKAPFSVKLTRNTLSVAIFSEKFNSGTLPDFIKVGVPDSLEVGTYTLTLKCGNVSLTADAENGTIYAAGNEASKMLQIKK